MNRLCAAALAGAAISVSSFGTACAQDQYEYGSAYKTATVLPANVIAGGH